MKILTNLFCVVLAMVSGVFAYRAYPMLPLVERAAAVAAVAMVVMATSLFVVLRLRKS